MKEEDKKLEALIKLCYPPKEYEDRDIRRDLKWDINYRLGDTEYFEIQSDPINESHLFSFANEKEEFMWRYPWINMQHEYGHAWLCENIDALFGFTDFSEIIARYSGRKGEIGYYMRHCILLVVDWFVEWLVYRRFPEPFRANERLILGKCIRSYQGVTKDFLTSFYYAYALAKCDLYEVSLNFNLPPQTPMIRSFRKVLIDAHPKTPSIDLCRDTVNKIFSIAAGIAGLKYNTKVDFMLRKIVRGNKEGEVRLWDIIITDL